MRTRKVEFEVPVAKMAEFAGELTRLQLDNQITGVQDDDIIEVEVVYTEDETEEVEELEAFFDSLAEEEE